MDLSMFRGNPLRTVADYEGDYQKLDAGRQALQQNALAMQEKQRAQMEAMQIRNALAGLGGNASDEQVAQALRGTGLPAGYAAADARLKAGVDRRKDEAATSKLSQEAEVEKIKKRVAAMGEVYSNVQRAPTLEAAQEAVGTGWQSGGFGSFKAASAVSNQMAGVWGDPAKRKAFLDDMGLSLVDAEKRFMEEASTKRSAATNATSASNNAATVAEQARGHTLTAGTAAARLNFDRDKDKSDSKTPKPADIVDPANPSQMIKVDLNKWNPTTREGVIGVAGKEPSAALREGKSAQGREGALDIIDTLRSAYQTLDQKRAIPSTERGAVSNVASGIAASGIGQSVGRFTGTEAQVERDVINSSRIQLLNGIKQATGMSAQQLNSNVELKLWLNAVSDPGQTYQAADRILGNIEKFVASGGKYSEKKGGGPPAGGAPPGVDPGDWQHMTPQERALWKPKP